MFAISTALRVEGNREEGFAAILLTARVHSEFREMPGLRLTVRQAARLFGVTPDLAGAVLRELQGAAVLVSSDDGIFSLISEPSRNRAASAVDGSLRDASVDRLACLLRHWTWADEAMSRFDRELTDGWDYDDHPMSDHPFGAYYHWCALLCAFAEAALDHGLLSPSRLAAMRDDLEATLPWLRACRQILVAIPASIEEQPRVVDLLHDAKNLSRLRRLHQAFGEALRQEQAMREIDALDP